jgi:hypothetical protein
MCSDGLSMAMVLMIYCIITQEVAARALKLTGNKSVEHAVQIIQKLSNFNDHRNGFSKISEAGKSITY